MSNRMRNPVGEGWWIAPDGRIIEINEHLRYIVDHPQLFGFDPDDKRFKGYWFKHREELLTEVIRKGWIRIRRVPHGQSIQFNRLDNRTLGGLSGFFASQPIGYMDQRTVFTELGRNRSWEETPADLMKVEANPKGRKKMKRRKLKKNPGSFAEKLEAEKTKLERILGTKLRWDLGQPLVGLDVLHLESVIKPGRNESLNDAITKKYGQNVTNLARYLVTGGRENKKKNPVSKPTMQEAKLHWLRETRKVLSSEAKASFKAGQYFLLDAGYPITISKDGKFIFKFVKHGSLVSAIDTGMKLTVPVDKIVGKADLIKKNPALEETETQYRKRIAQRGPIARTFGYYVKDANTGFIWGWSQSKEKAEAKVKRLHRKYRHAYVVVKARARLKRKKKTAGAWLKRHRINPVPWWVIKNKDGKTLGMVQSLAEAKRKIKPGDKVYPSSGKVSFEVIRTFSMKKRRKNPVLVSRGGKGVHATRARKYAPSPEAVRKFHLIHGTDPDRIQKVNDGTNQELVVLGYVTAIEYKIPFSTHRSSKSTTWRHPFNKKPVLCLTKKGKPVILWGSSHRITERGLIG